MRDNSLATAQIDALSTAAELPMTRPAPDSPWVIWGGLLGRGGLKLLTFSRYLATLDAARATRGIVEISEGCTALALEHLAARAGVPVTILCSPAGEAKLRARGYLGETLIPRDLGQALAICQERQRAGWLWPDQMSNPLLVSAVAAWATELVPLLRTRAEVAVVACGFGTGATVAGLHRALSAHGYQVIGLQSPPGVSIDGWRNYSERNLGDRDLFHCCGGGSALQTAEPPCETGSTPLSLLLSHDFGTAAARVCVVSHDGTPDSCSSPRV